MHNSHNEAETVDYEHVIQLRLVESLVNSAQRESNAASRVEIFDQLLIYSEAHFMAEQLLMRLHAYPEYEEHTKQHDNLIESCRLIQQTLKSGDLGRFAAATVKLKENLRRHIEGSDRSLGAFLRKPSTWKRNQANNPSLS